MEFFKILKRPSLLLIVIPLIVIPLLFLGTTTAMIKVWMVNETFTHGFLVFPISVWLIWQRRSQLLLVKPVPELRVMALLVLLLLTWLISAIVEVQVVQQIIMISIIITTIWMIAGRRIVALILFPLVFLFFSVPLGQGLIPPLMVFTADFTVALIQLTGIPVYREGLFFTLPSGTWSVVEECSGVRYLLASFTLGSIYAYLNYSSLKKRLVFILLSLIVPILGNGFRAYGIVLTGHYSGMELAVGADHLLYGWVFFGIIIFVLFYIGSFWWDPEEAAVNQDSADAEDNPGGHDTTHPSFLLMIVTFILIVGTYFSSDYIADYKLGKVKSASLLLPDTLANWQFDKNRLLGWQPIFLNSDIAISRGYDSEYGFVQLNIGFYLAQRQGAEVISTMNRIASPHGGTWKKIRSSEIFINGKSVIETELKGDGHHYVLVWHWYRIGQYETSNPYIAKVIDAFNLILKGRTDASMISVSTLLDDNKDSSRKRLKNFWQEANDETEQQMEKLISE